MSGIEDQGMRPPGVDAAPAEDADEAPDGVEQVPAGRAGADSGSADAVRIDPDDDAEIPDSSEMNDEPGVGPGDPRRWSPPRRTHRRG